MSETGETEASSAEQPAEDVHTFWEDASQPRVTGRELLPGAPMTELWLVGAALATGIAADALAVDRPPGLGLALVLIAVLALILVFHAHRGLGLASRNRFAIVAALALLALAFAVRTSTMLLTIDAVACFVGVIMLSVRVTGRRLRDSRPAELAMALVELPVVASVRAWFVIGRRLRSSGQSSTNDDAAGRGSGVLRGHGRDILLGLAIAVPILAVFSALLAASDAGFKRIVEGLFDFDFAQILVHGWSIVWVTAVVLATLVAALVSSPTTRFEERRRTWAGPAVVWIVLGSTCALFASFLALQGSYLFGGAGYLEERTGLTAAEYARSGFFELIVVSGLTVALILAARGSFAAKGGSARAYRILAPVLAALTIVLLGSAMARLFVYADRFGLTGQRIYAVAILVWIAAVLGWLGSRIAMDRSLQHGAFAGCFALLVVIALNAVNPDAMAARSNIERRGTSGDRSIDVDYLRSLSEDATPAIAERLERIPPSERGELRSALERRVHRRDGDWRSWNLGHERAADALDD